MLGLGGALFNLFCDSQVLVSLYGSMWFWIYLCPILVPGIFVVGSHFKPEYSNWKDLETWKKLAHFFLILQPVSMVLFPILYFFGCKSLILKVFIFLQTCTCSFILSQICGNNHLQVMTTYQQRHACIPVS
jgi:hypothetical protein